MPDDMTFEDVKDHLRMYGVSEEAVENLWGDELRDIGDALSTAKRGETVARAATAIAESKARPRRQAAYNDLHVLVAFDNWRANPTPETEANYEKALKSVAGAKKDGDSAPPGDKAIEVAIKRVEGFDPSTGEEADETAAAAIASFDGTLARREIRYCENRLWFITEENGDVVDALFSSFEEAAERAAREVEHALELRMRLWATPESAIAEVEEYFAEN